MMHRAFPHISCLGGSLSILDNIWGRSALVDSFIAPISVSSPPPDVSTSRRSSSFPAYGEKNVRDPEGTPSRGSVAVRIAAGRGKDPVYLTRLAPAWQVPVAVER